MVVCTRTHTPAHPPTHTCSPVHIQAHMYRMTLRNFCWERQKPVVSMPSQVGCWTGRLQKSY